MLHINRYPVWPDGTRKKQSGFGPLSGTLIEKYDARYAFDPNDLVAPGNPWGVPTFLWIEGNGTGATIGPAGLNLAATGVITQVVTPYQYPNGVDGTAEMYSGTSFRRDTVRRLSPLDDDDIVVMVKYKHSNIYTGGGPDTFIATTTRLSGVSGWYVCLTNGNLSAEQQVGAARITVSAGGIGGSGFCRTYGIFGFVMNRDGNTYAWYDGKAGTNAVTLAGGLGGDGIALGASTAGALHYALAGQGIEWVSAWYGAGLYEVWSADTWRLTKRLQFESLGLRETEANKVPGVNKYWSFSHAGGGSGNDSGSSYIDHNGEWRFSSREAPRAGNPNGVVLGAYQINSIVGGGSSLPNVDPAATGGWTATGGVLSVVNDAAGLLAAKASVWGPNVFSFANATGVSQIVYGFVAGAIYRQALFLLARYAAGANALLGWRDQSDGSFTSIGAILDNYALTSFYWQLPAQADWRYAIQIPDGCTLYFIGQSWHIASAANGPTHNKYPVPWFSGHWSSEVQREIATTEHSPVALSGSYRVRLAPTCWSGTAVAVDDSVLPCVTTPGDILHAESVAAGWATSDGTTQIQTVAPYVPTAGVYVDVWSAWRAALQYVQQDLTLPSLVTGAYDGAKGTVGALQAAPSVYGGEIVVQYVEVRQV